jgi:lipopolysaccharide export LptBFGC system permease protein LptF
MDDGEARYLIDQFNKFASWRIAETQFELSQSATLIALLAVGLSVVGISWQYTKPPTEFAFVSTLFLMVIVLGIYVAMRREYRAVRAEHKDDASRLLALEDHYSRFKSLPSITLAKIVDSKFTPEDLKKLLKESEPSPTGSPKT